MDRLNQLRGDAGGSKDSTLDTTAPPSEAFMTANESSSKYFSLSEVDSTFDISGIKDVSLASTATAESEESISNQDDLISNLSPISKKSDILDGYKIGKQIEAANILSGGVDIFDDNNSYDGDELVIDDNAEDDKSNPEKPVEGLQYKSEDNIVDPTLVSEDIGSKDTEVVLQIDGKNVDAIDIGNGLYLYRKEGEEELAAVQIIDDDQHQPSFKFLKVRENAEGNLEVYEEIEIEVPKEVPAKEVKTTDKDTSSHVPIKDINKVINDLPCNKNAEKKVKTPPKEPTPTCIVETEDMAIDTKSDVNLSGKMKFSDCRKSPVIGSFTPMTYHSTPNKEGKPLTKTMVDQQLHPNRHSDNVKKTIEVHTDSSKQKPNEASVKSKDLEDSKITEINTTEKGVVVEETTGKSILIVEEKDLINSESKTSGVVDAIAIETDALNPNNAVLDTNKVTEKEVLDTIEVIDTKPEEVNDSVIPMDSDDNNKEILDVKENLGDIENVTQKILETGEVDKGVAANIDQIKTVISDEKDDPITKEATLSGGEKTKEIMEVEVILDKKTNNNSNNNSLDTAGSKEDHTTKDDKILSEPIKNQDDSKLQNKFSVPEGTSLEENIIQDVAQEIVISDTVKNAETNDINMVSMPGSLCSDNVYDKDLKIIETTGNKSEAICKSKDVISEDMALTKTLPIDECKDVKDNGPIDILLKSASSAIKEIVVDEKVAEKIEHEKKELKIDIIKPEGKQTILIVKPAKLVEVTSEDVPKKSCSLELLPAKISVTPPKVPDIEPNLKQVSKDKINAPLEIVNKSLAMRDKHFSNLNKKPVLKTREQNPIVQELKPPRLPNEGVEKKAVMVAQPLPIAISKPVPEQIVKGTKVESNRVPKIEPTKIPSTGVAMKNVSSSSVDKKNDHSIEKTEPIKNKTDPRDRNEGPKNNPEPTPMNNNHAAVPFGQWTDANRQEFLNKFKAKVPTASSNGNQIKNSNDLNRRDVLKKIDSQRQSSNALSKAQDATKHGVKNESAFSKTNIIPQESKIPVKTEAIELKVKPVAEKVTVTQEKISKTQEVIAPTKTDTASVPKNDPKQRTPVNYQDLIDNTIEAMLHVKQNYPSIDEHATLDAIEMKMNELHGIPFIERPPHELPQVQKSDAKGNKPEPETQTASKDKTTKIPSLLPFCNKPTNLQKNVKENFIEIDSEEEIIEHEPITGDIELKSTHIKPPSTENSSIDKTEKLSTEAFIKEAIITEKDFEKFARRNSITYENCITVNFDGKEPHNVIQTIVEKETAPKSHPRNDTRVDNKVKLPHKPQNVQENTQTSKLSANKFEQANAESPNRNQSKFQKAYHSALTAKRQMECPITIIEDKPVQVVFMDNMQFVPSQLNVQGQDLSPTKKLSAESDAVTVGTGDSMDSDILDSVADVKAQDEVKVKTKHQRKQVLTPVEEPELELIEPKDLGIEVSPKKKRKTEDEKEKSVKYPMRKKMYLLGSGVIEEKQHNTQDVTYPLIESVNRNENVNPHKSTVSAIDNLVKAAELIETQTENSLITSSPNLSSQQNTPVKRGRGRPRKYPLPDGSPEKTKVPSPQKKPRLIDAKPVKRDTISDEEDSEGVIIKENWTMGKINENIVCPICNKLFRTENVVFKHVKHCTGPSPNRSDSDKRSPRTIRYSQDSDDTKSRESKFDDMDIDDEKLSDLKLRKESPKMRKSIESVAKLDKDEVIVIEDTPDKEKTEKVDSRKLHESRKLKSYIPFKASDLVCEFCGKTFRQLSYLVSHKLQHNKEDSKKSEKEAPVANKSVYSCDVCKKEFRKLHHLVQHRIIHNLSSAPARSLRKSSSELAESKTEKEATTSKQSEDLSAGFRCEPCDKSFRKLHHLVEHRETHDGINRQKTTMVPQNNPEKPVTMHGCDICKKTFKKLQHLTEHKEQHMDTGSEKSDDKSIKSSLSTRDIIHECSLCYMVFPNEHSLNKHTIICQRKKRQSKQKQVEESEVAEEASDITKIDAEMTEDTDTPKIVEEIKENEIKEESKVKEIGVDKIDLSVNKTDEPVQVSKKESSPPTERKENEDTSVEVQPPVLPLKRDNAESKRYNTKKEEVSEVPEKIQKVEGKEIVKIRDPPKKKTPLKDKAVSSVTKRLRTATAPVPVTEEMKPAVESSDDDEVRYMFNPNFKVEETEEKVFMKVRAKKRSSLQIERPNSKDLVKRRISLQHPPKIPRLKQKSLENAASTIKATKLEPVPSTDSDDSDVKYSFPKTVPEKTSKPVADRTSKIVERKTPRKPLAEKRKTLSGIAKRKSLGKAVVARHKASPMKQVKRRTMEVEHRCDCGQLFSSAALLSRHTTLAHTPPRIRRKRSPPPDEAKPLGKPGPRKSTIAESQTKAKNTACRKSSVRSDASTSNAKSTAIDKKTGRKSVSSPKTSVDANKSKADKSEAKSSVKPRRTGAHRGVPVPDKMRKLMQKNNK